MTNTIASHSVTEYTDIRDTVPGAVKADLDYRVFVEVMEDGHRVTKILAYKTTQLAADRAANKIGREHAYGSIESWGWELKDKYNAARW